MINVYNARKSIRFSFLSFVIVYEFRAALFNFLDDSLLDTKGYTHQLSQAEQASRWFMHVCAFGLIEINNAMITIKVCGY